MSSASPVNVTHTSDPAIEKESQLVSACLQLLQLRGVFCWRQNSGGMKQKCRDRRERLIRFTSINGISDIIGVLPGGRLLAAECKRVGNRPTPDQQAFLDAVTRRGGLAVVVYAASDLLEIVDRELRKAAAA